MQGWIKLHRKIRANPIFNDHQLMRLWLICLTEATHKERDQIIGKQTVHLMPGEFVTGRYDLTEMYNNGLKPKDKVKGDKTCFRWLETLEKGGFLTIKKTNKFSVVTIDNWALYQDTEQLENPPNDHQMTIKRPSNDHQMTTNKNVKNIKNDNKEKEEEEPPKNWTKVIWDYWDKNGFGFHAIHQKEKLIQWTDENDFDEPNEIVLFALEVAADSNAKNYNYVHKILTDWSNRKLRTLEKVKMAQEEFKQKISISKGGHTKQNNVDYDALRKEFKGE